MSTPENLSLQTIAITERHSAHNYHPLPVVVSRAEGCWVWDQDGRRYLDMLAAYSAVNFGHRHPALTQACKDQLDRVTLTSRAFHNDQLGDMCAELAELCAMDMVLPMNTGAEGVETAIKTARKWGYDRKGVLPGRAVVITCDGNFHGRTTTIVSFSTDEQARRGFGPYTPGFQTVDYGDAAALEAAIDENTVAFLMEPIQGERGVWIPPTGYLQKVREICSRHNVLFIADEIQSGLGRTGKTFACDHENVKPDMYILGKALGGGIMPVSAVVANRDVLGVFQPGDHGSTFGGNPLAAAVARAVIKILKTGEFQTHAARLGEYMRERLERLPSSQIAEIRVRGLWAGVQLSASMGNARKYCERLMAEGILCKETHGDTIRIAPPLCIKQDELDWALDTLTKVLSADV